MADDRRIALVYRGPAACSTCPGAVADLLRSARWDFKVVFVGDDQRCTISRATLAGAVLYAQPGGGNSLERAYRSVKGKTELIRGFVREGGRYLGVCMGGYLADSWRGFGLLPPGAEADSYVHSRGADVATRRDTLVDVRWRGFTEPLPMFFQDGPLFRLPPNPPEGTTVLGRYAANGEVAALVAPFGRGWVAACGPHPEAPESWYAAHDLAPHHDVCAPLGHDLIDALLSAGGGAEAGGAIS